MNSRGEFYFSSLCEAASGIRDREISSVELVGAELERIRELDPILKSFITVADEQSLKSAEEADAALERGDKVGPLHEFRSR